MNWKLIGSAVSFEALAELVMKRWGWTDFVVEETGEVGNGTRKIDDLRVTVLRKRWRLEMRGTK